MRGTIVNRTGWGNWNGHTSGTPGTSILVNPNSGALGAGAGGTAALSYGNDGSAVITIVTAGVPVAGTVATVSFGTPKEYGFMSLIPLNAAANALQISTNSLRMQYPPRNTGFDLINDGLGLATGTTYIFGFQSK